VKTPLTSMKGLAQLLAGFDLTPPRAEALSRASSRRRRRASRAWWTRLDVERLQVRS
jgi:hypothetical protein